MCDGNDKAHSVELPNGLVVTIDSSKLLEELKEKLPEELKPLVDRFGPQLIGSSVDEIVELFGGILIPVVENYSLLTGEELEEAGGDLLVAWDSANKGQAERRRKAIELAHKFVIALVNILLTLLLAGLNKEGGMISIGLEYPVIPGTPTIPPELNLGLEENNG